MTTVSKSRQHRGRDGTISALNVAIEEVNLMEEVSNIPPAKAVFGSVNALLAMIRDSTSNEQDFVGLGLGCVDVCQILSWGLQGRRSDDLNLSALVAMQQLTESVVEMQRDVIKQGKRNTVSRVLRWKSNKDKIAAWRRGLDMIVHVFQSELVRIDIARLHKPEPDHALRVVPANFPANYVDTLGGTRVWLDGIEVTSELVENASPVLSASAEFPSKPEGSPIPPSAGTPACARLISGATSSPREVISLIETIMASKVELGAIHDLCEDDAQILIDVIHEAMGLPDFPPHLLGGCLRALCRICGRRGLLPKPLHVPRCYNRSDRPLYRGGFADVWKGELRGSHVAVKELRVCSNENLSKIARRFCKEVVTWNALRHPNVLQLLGISMDKDHFAMVSEWMLNGNINEFVEEHGEANRFELLKGVTNGLMYMHSQGMIHGDLKGANILVDENGHARLADFGLLTIASDPTIFTASSSIAAHGTTRWMSPELIDPEYFGLDDSRPTKESDCYALGMVIYEVLSGRVPFATLSHMTVAREVVKGKRPTKPEGAEGELFADDLWETMGQCWATEPTSRPDIKSVFDHLEQGSRSWKPPGANWCGTCCGVESDISILSA